MITGRTTHRTPPNDQNAIGTMGVFLLFGVLTVVALGYFYRRCRKLRARPCKS